MANDADSDDTIQIGELDETGMLADGLHDRLVGLLSDFGLSETDDAEDLIPFLIPATHDDELTVDLFGRQPRGQRVQDGNYRPGGPEVTLVRPAHKLFTRTNVVTLQARSLIPARASSRAISTSSPASIQAPPPLGLP